MLIRNTRIEQEMNRKHKPRYMGPYVLRENRKSRSWKINKLDGTSIRTIVAGFRILPYVTRNFHLLKIMEEEIEGQNFDEDKEGEEML